MQPSLVYNSYILPYLCALPSVTAYIHAWHSKVSARLASGMGPELGYSTVLVAIASHTATSELLLQSVRPSSNLVQS